MHEAVLPLCCALLGAGATTWALTPLVARLASRLGVVDTPGGRRAHTRVTPRMGGVAVAGGLLVGASAYGFAFGFDRLLAILARDDLLAFMLPCLLVFLIGLVDDIRGLSPASRIVAEAVAASFLIQAGYVIDVVANPLGDPIHLGVFAFPITVLWFVGVTNAFNLIDGLDGLLSTVAITALVGCVGVALHADRLASATLAMALVGSLAGFLWWNWHPARIFLGDSGSLLIGFATAALSIKVSRNPSGTFPLHVPVLLCALPIAEMALTLARRWVTGQPVWVGDRSHIHHVLLKKGLGVPRAVVSLWAVGALFAIAAVLSRMWRQQAFLLACVALSFVAALGLRWLGYLELQVLRDRLAQLLRGRRVLPDLLALASAGDGIRRAAPRLQDLQDQLRSTVAEARLSFLAVELAPSLSERLGGTHRLLECHNASAERFLTGRSAVQGTLWLFSSTDLAPCAKGSICYTIPLTGADGVIGQLTCERPLSDSDGAAHVAVTRYIGAPLAEALQRLLRVSSGSVVTPA